MSAPELEGTYYIINTDGEIGVENFQVDGLTSFVMVLYRGGIVGNEFGARLRHEF